MRISVLGASRLAVATTRQLIGKGHEVVLIEQDRDRTDELAETLDCGMIHGDGTLPHTLKDAFGDGSDALLESHQVGHDLAGMRIIGQPVDDRNGRVFRQFRHAGRIAGPDHDPIDIAR